MIDLDGALREMLQAIGVCAYGIFDTSSDTVPADSTRTEGDDQFNGCLLMPLDGTYAGIAKRIFDYTGIGGIFTIEVTDPFPGVTGLVPYFVISRPGGAGTLATTIGDLTDAIPPMDEPPNNVYTAMQYLKGIMERVGATPADPDDSLLTNVGQRDDAATADDMSDITTTSIIAKLRLILNRLSTDAFTATIQGAARTALDTMLEQLATYLTAGGAAMSIQVNNGAARTNLELALEDFFGVFGCDNANVFDPAMFGGSQTTLEAAFDALATALGAEFDGTPDMYDVMVTGYDSSAQAPNEDGSIIERQDYIQQQIGYGSRLIEADAGSTATAIIDAAALTEGIDDWWKGALLFGIDGQNQGQARIVINFGQAADTLTVYPAFLNAPIAGDHFILISSARPWVWDQQPDVAINTTAINAAETDIFDLNVAKTSYMINSLRLKAVDPGANTITVRLYELINDAPVVVQTFNITTANFGTYFSLVDMFGLSYLAGDDIQITVQCDAGGPYAVTGQYQHALAKNG